MATIEEVQQAIKSWAAGTYRGITTDTLGAPVDIINLAISPITKPLGIYSDNPAFGSKHLRQIAGMPTEDANIIETASGMTSPGGAVHAMIVGAARLGRAVAGEKALQSGENMAEVFNKTGAYMDADNKWKTVISDVDAKVLPAVTNVPHFTIRGDNLETVLDHPELYKLYPELREIPVRNAMSGIGTGATNGQVIQIGTGTERTFEQYKDTYKDVLLHEVQHVIQGIEGYTHGANPDQFRKIPREAENKLKDFTNSPVKPPPGVSAEVDAADRFLERIKIDKQRAFDKYENVQGEQEARFTGENRNASIEGLGASVLRLLRNEKSPQSWDTRIGNK
jgi:hypothetical protein